MESSNENSGHGSPLLKKRPQLAPSTPYLLSNKYAARRAPHSSPKPDSVVQRILSVKEQRIKYLENDLANLRRQLHDLSTENRTLKAQNQKNLAALSRFQDVEAELPTLLAGHTEEVRALRQRCQKLAADGREQARELRNKTVALHLAKDQLAHLRGVIDDKGIKDKQALHKHLDEAEQRVRELDEQLTHVSRQLSLEQRSNRHYLAREQRRVRELQDELKTAKERLEQLEGEARWKEKRVLASQLFRKSPAPMKAVKKEESAASSHYSDLNLSSSDEEELTKLYRPVVVPSEPDTKSSLQTQWAVDSRTFSVRQTELAHPQPRLKLLEPPKSAMTKLAEVNEEEREASGDEDEEGDNYTKEALLRALEEIDRQNSDTSAVEKTENLITSNGQVVGVAD
jgi:Ciliary protein causing Leber congenital amaurosis disease